MFIFENLATKYYTIPILIHVITYIYDLSTKHLLIVDAFARVVLYALEVLKKPEAMSFHFANNQKYEHFTSPLMMHCEYFL